VFARTKLIDGMMGNKMTALSYVGGSVLDVAKGVVLMHYGKGHAAAEWGMVRSMTDVR